MEVVKGFLEMEGVMINAPTIGNETPLHKAVQFSRAECVAVLLKGGADPFIRNKVGEGEGAVRTECVRGCENPQQ